MDNVTLNGFEVFEDLMPGASVKNKPIVSPTNEEEEETKIDLEGVGEELSEEELNNIRKNTKTETEEEKEEELEEEDKEVKSKSKAKPKTTTKEETEEPEVEEEEPEESTDETTIVTGFFDSLASQLGWDDVEDDEKPRTAEDLIDYFKEVIEENSTPQYASEEVEKLDKFVHNGGKLKDYFSIDADLDIDNIEIEDDEVNQKLVIKEFLKEKGFTSKQIEKKLNKYEEAGLLEDEATDALEALRDIKVARKEELLANQEKQAREAEKQQRDFFNNVVTEIKGMDSIYGIDIPEKDKKALLEYIFKPDADGITRYQKDYAKSLKNLITSAYFTMKGDTLIDIAKKKGKKDAIDNFKNTLSRNSGVSKKSKRQVINNDSNSSIWDAFARQLRVA